MQFKCVDDLFEHRYADSDLTHTEGLKMAGSTGRKWKCKWTMNMILKHATQRAAGRWHDRDKYYECPVHDRQLPSNIPNLCRECVQDLKRSAETRIAAGEDPRAVLDELGLLPFAHELDRLEPSQAQVKEAMRMNKQAVHERLEALEARIAVLENKFNT